MVKIENKSEVCVRTSTGTKRVVVLKPPLPDIFSLDDTPKTKKRKIKQAVIPAGGIVTRAGNIVVPNVMPKPPRGDSKSRMTSKSPRAINNISSKEEEEDFGLDGTPMGADSPIKLTEGEHNKRSDENGVHIQNVTENLDERSDNSPENSVDFGESPREDVVLEDVAQQALVQDIEREIDELLAGQTDNLASDSLPELLLTRENKMSENGNDPSKNIKNGSASRNNGNDPSRNINNVDSNLVKSLLNKRKSDRKIKRKLDDRKLDRSLNGRERSRERQTRAVGDRLGRDRPVERLKKEPRWKTKTEPNDPSKNINNVDVSRPFKKEKDNNDPSKNINNIGKGDEIIGHDEIGGTTHDVIVDEDNPFKLEDDNPFDVDNPFKLDAFDEAMKGVLDTNEDEELSMAQIVMEEDVQEDVVMEDGNLSSSDRGSRSASRSQLERPRDKKCGRIRICNDPSQNINALFLDKQKDSTTKENGGDNSSDNPFQDTNSDKKKPDALKLPGVAERDPPRKGNDPSKNINVLSIPGKSDTGECDKDKANSGSFDDIGKSRQGRIRQMESFRDGIIMGNASDRNDGRNNGNLPSKNINNVKATISRSANNPSKNINAIPAKGEPGPPKPAVCSIPARGSNSSNDPSKNINASFNANGSPRMRETTRSTRNPLTTRDVCSIPTKRDSNDPDTVKNPFISSRNVCGIPSKSKGNNDPSRNINAVVSGSRIKDPLAKEVATTIRGRGRAPLPARRSPAPLPGSSRPTAFSRRSPTRRERNSSAARDVVALTNRNGISDFRKDTENFRSERGNAFSKNDVSRNINGVFARRPSPSPGRVINDPRKNINAIPSAGRSLNGNDVSKNINSTTARNPPASRAPPTGPSRGPPAREMICGVPSKSRNNPGNNINCY